MGAGSKNQYSGDARMKEQQKKEAHIGGWEEAAKEVEHK